MTDINQLIFVNHHFLQLLSVTRLFLVRPVQMFDDVEVHVLRDPEIRPGKW